MNIFQLKYKLQPKMNKNLKHVLMSIEILAIYNSLNGMCRTLRKIIRNPSPILILAQTDYLLSLISISIIYCQFIKT
jgi:hypothetical protein